VRKVYDAEKPLSDDELGRQLFDDQLFAAGAQGLAGFVAKANAPAYVYRFAYIADALRSKIDGVGHGGELPYVFGLRGLAQEPWMQDIVAKATPKDLSIIAMMQTYWTSFAKTGSPNDASSPQWSATSFAAPQTLLVDDSTHAEKDFRRKQIDLVYARWSKLAGMPAP